MSKKSISLLFIFLFACSTNLFAHDDQNVTPTFIGNGIGIGSALAIAIC